MDIDLVKAAQKSGAKFYKRSRAMREGSADYLKTESDYLSEHLGNEARAIAEISRLWMGVTDDDYNFA